jgi:hypothetical protein
MTPSRFLGLFALTLILTPLLPGTTQAQEAQTFHACYVPQVGAMYLINLPGLPEECLSENHVAISWTEGEELADGAVTTEKLAEGAVTTAVLADGAVTGPKLAFDCAPGQLVKFDGGGWTCAEDAVGATGFVRVASNLTPIFAGEVRTFSVSCSDDRPPVGGGGWVDGIGGVVLLRSYPTVTGWEVMYQNTTGVNRSGYAWVVCAVL